MVVQAPHKVKNDWRSLIRPPGKKLRLDFCADAIRHAADDEKLAGIGFHWGFSDQSHFSTVFKQRFGMTPGEYRRKFR
jgi:transcriptional regulator GlxA family with amidase domain